MAPHDISTPRNIVGSSAADLKEYEQHKFAMAEIIRSAQAMDSKDGELQSQCRELAARLAEDKFNLVVIGRFSRGKSTLMNALLGREYLPTGIVPLTSVITTVRYGSRKQVVLHFTHSGLSHQVPLSQLPDYVTQKGNPGNVKKVAYAEIELPVEILRRGFFFVDTPGLGSPIVENTLTTERFLPEADAFVLVTSYESPLSEEEDRILNRIRGANKKIFVVINKQDTVTQEERGEALNFVEERLSRYSFTQPPQVFSVSARQAIEAKLAENRALLSESQIELFETELHRFLIEERALAFLANMYERTMSFLIQRSRIPAGPLSDATSGKYQVLMERLRNLHEPIFGVDGRHAAPRKGMEDGIQPYVLDIEKQAGCFLCAAVLSSVFKYLSKYQYTLSIDPSVQREHAARRGFCTLHTWQYETISSPYGVCTAYPELAYRLAAELRAIAQESHQGRYSPEKVRTLLSNTKTCPVCGVRVAAEQEAVEEMAARVRNAAGAADAHAPVLCLPHLTMLAGRLGAGEPAARLLEGHAELFERTAEDLQRYAVKHDALRRYLTSEEERKASLLALLLLAGHRNVSAPWIIESII